ncbi:hypothetical protein Ae406Ps2_2446 [Pseudonocardia sp. Ae406_Ps2]|nr:hypothetical protein Ae331Ps2_3471c [Pseudonocardia sp. Ae331_Ps2]OLM02446.1 hypothetical protein Ae406Ps2_2446 [Pseudonocardia sp. Ae406_Ps2]OLM12719.1 hypothetical protein Ae505Ps2_2847c [Pseudonocardia sp. Ae505_Ps2]OLM24018.1 hypothetical protein Ae706Ps2_2451 [Pseudonocardia sp. Ae706_Ps2]
MSSAALGATPLRVRGDGTSSIQSGSTPDAHPMV